MHIVFCIAITVAVLWAVNAYEKEQARKRAEIEQIKESIVALSDKQTLAERSLSEMNAFYKEDSRVYDETYH